MAEDGSVVIAIDGDDSGFQATAENLEKSILSLADTLATQGQAAGDAFQQALANVPTEVQQAGAALSSLTGTMDSCMAAMERDIESGVASMRAALEQAGVHLSEGLWAGVSESSSWLQTRLRSWCGTMVASVKSAFGIHSPSRVMRDEVGCMLAQGMALGIEDGAAEVKSALTALSSMAMDSARDDAANYEDIGAKYVANLTYGVESGRDKSIKTMQDWVDADVAAYEARIDARTDALVAAKQALMTHANNATKAALSQDIETLKAGAETQKKAYEAAAEVTTAYKKALETGYDEALSVVENKITAITDAAQEQYDALQDKIGDMQSSLSDVDLYTLNDKTGEVSLTNWDKQTDAVEKYAAALEALKNKGVSDDFLSEVTGLDTDEATAYMEKLLTLSEEKFQKYLEGWQTERDTAKQVAQAFYQDQLDTLHSDFKDKLTDALASVPQTMTSIGVDSIRGMIEGLYSESGALSAAATAIVNRAIAAMKAAADIHSPSRKTRDLIGKNMAAGIAVGFDAEMGSVYQSIQGTLTDTIAGLSATSTLQASYQVAQSNAASAAAQTAAGTSVQNTTTVEFTGSLSALGRVLQPVITAETQRVGTNLVKGAT